MPDSAPEHLDEYLATISCVFDDYELFRPDGSPVMEKQEIATYYSDAQIGYKWLHTRSGAMHMAINTDETFDAGGFAGQAAIVQRWIDEVQAHSVLELACGHGYNSNLLANQNPEASFIGVDLTPVNVDRARERAQGQPNVQFECGDFENLAFEDETFDLIFAVEGLCHAVDLKEAFIEAHRVLASGGLLVVIDGFRVDGFDELDERLQWAAELVERSWFVGHASKLGEWLSVARVVGFEIVASEDLTDAIRPNLLRIQRVAKTFFKYRPVTRLLKRILPDRLGQNMVGGLLIPMTVGAGAQIYQSVVLRKS